MTTKFSGSQIVKTDEGAVNARILAREAKVDFRRVEAASIKVVTRLTSAEGKRLFVRFFSTLQLNAHFISVLARTRLDSDDVAKVEAAIKARIDTVAEALNKAIDGAEALFQANGITSAATYDTQALEIEVGIISSTGRRYLDLIGKLDQLMPLLQTLEIHEVISTQALDIQRATLKRQVRDCANSARSLATGLRRRMNALAAGASAAGTGPSAQAPTGEAAHGADDAQALGEPSQLVEGDGIPAGDDEPADLVVEADAPGADKSEHPEPDS
ncbi:DUF1845 domain-containing protein [Ottowia sp.]|uniref:DUF1845 domain-containing protein n=1 Tax=Ottowia sp. TaxID=1898956 RepID=UPI00261C536D|nr:DUF1845 domain-containing protein [Ottowia sp.]